MKEKRSQLSDVPLSLVASLAALIFAGGGAFAWWMWQIQEDPTSKKPLQTEQPAQNQTTENPVTDSPTDPSSSTAQSPTEQSVQIYWLQDTGTGFELVPTTVTVAQAAKPEAALTQAFQTLLAPQADTESKQFNAIPEGTTLLDLSVKSDGVYVNLSQKFTEGGGSSSMMGRLGQVVYTATAMDTNAPVWLSVDGNPLEVLGGEGIVVEQPMTRQDFEENFPL